MPEQYFHFQHVWNVYFNLVVCRIRRRRGVELLSFYTNVKKYTLSAFQNLIRNFRRQTMKHSIAQFPILL